MLFLYSTQRGIMQSMHIGRIHQLMCTCNCKINKTHKYAVHTACKQYRYMHAYIHTKHISRLPVTTVTVISICIHIATTRLPQLTGTQPLGRAVERVLPRLWSRGSRSWGWHCREPCPPEAWHWQGQLAAWRETTVDFYTACVLYCRPTQLLTFANVYIVQLWLHLS